MCPTLGQGMADVTLLGITCRSNLIEILERKYFKGQQLDVTKNVFLYFICVDFLDGKCGNLWRVSGRGPLQGEGGGDHQRRVGQAQAAVGRAQPRAGGLVLVLVL